MADAEKSACAKKGVKDNQARDRSVHLPVSTNGLAYLHSATQVSIPQYSMSYSQGGGGDAIYMAAKWTTLKNQCTATKSERHKREVFKRHSSAYSLLSKEEKLTGVTANIPLKSPPCADAGNTEQHDTKRQWDAKHQAERASYNEPTCLKMQDCNKRRKSY